MEIRRDIRVAVGAILGFQVLVAFGTIALLERTSPASLQILNENLLSIEYTEEMLSSLIPPFSPGTPRAIELEQKFRSALQNAKANITEEIERGPLEMIERSIDAAFNGDSAQRDFIADAIRSLSRANHQAMIRSIEEARRLSTAGVWIIVLLGFIGFLSGAIAMRRLHARVIHPVGELCNAVQAWRQGDHLRRCEALGAPQELRQAMHLINDLFDEHAAAAPSDGQENRHRERAVLLHLLEREAEAAVIIDYYGNIAAANNKAIRILSGVNGDKIKEQLSQVPSGQSGPDLLNLTAIRGIHWWQVILR